jgi:Cna protein B-type domain.
MKKFFRFSLFAIFLAVFCGVGFAQETGGVKGKVRTTRGVGIPDATVTARQKGQDIKTVKTDSAGNFVLDGLEEGLYNLVFTKNGYSSGTLYNVEVKKKKVRDLGPRLILTSDQGTMVILRGSVFNQDGFGIPGVKIEIEKISENGSKRKIGSGYSREGGEFTFRFPEEIATYRVTASFKGVSASKDVTVEGAAVYGVAVTLELPKQEK